MLFISAFSDSIFGQTNWYWREQSGGSNAWTTASNWSTSGYGGTAASSVPNSSRNVFIRKGNGTSGLRYPLVNSGTAQCRNLTLEIDVADSSSHKHGTVHINNGAVLRINGNYSNTAGKDWVFREPVGSLFDFNNVGEVELYRTTTGTSTISGRSYFLKLKINCDDGLGTANASIASGAQFIFFSLDPENGNFNTNALLTTNARSSFTAYIDGDPSNNGSIVGDVTVQVYVTENYKCYHHVGIPVSSPTTQIYGSGQQLTSSEITGGMSLFLLTIQSLLGQFLISSVSMKQMMILIIPHLIQL